MKEIIDVNTGQVKVTSDNVTLRALAIGSCIVIAAYDSTKKTAAMAHIMLPGNAPADSTEKTKYAADGIEQMINKMLQIDSNPQDIEVCLVGGGNVLKKVDDTVCKNNIRSTTQLLTDKHISIKAAALGGTKRKAVFLDSQTGNISFTQADEQQKVLWQPKEKLVSKL